MSELCKRCGELTIGGDSHCEPCEAYLEVIKERNKLRTKVTKLEAEVERVSEDNGEWEAACRDWKYLKEQTEAEVGSLRLTLIETLAELQSHNAIMTKLGADKEAMQKALQQIAEYKTGISPVTVGGMRYLAQQALKENMNNGND